MAQYLKDYPDKEEKEQCSPSHTGVPHSPAAALMDTSLGIWICSWGTRFQACFLKAQGAVSPTLRSPSTLSGLQSFASLKRGCAVGNWCPWKWQVVRCGKKVPSSLAPSTWRALKGASTAEPQPYFLNLPGYSDPDVGERCPGLWVLKPGEL